MKRYLFLSYILFTVFTSSSCQEEQLTQQQEAAHLETLLNDLEAMTKSVSCNDPSEWTFVAFGSKACGGPSGYLAYSSKIDTEFFLQRVRDYTSEQQQFNERWGVFSNCSVPSLPAGIYCDNGAAAFSY